MHNHPVHHYETDNMISGNTKYSYADKIFFVNTLKNIANAVNGTL